MAFPLYFLGIFALVFANRLYSLYKNYAIARLMKIPIIVRLESWQDPIWMLLGPRIRGLLSYIGHWDYTATDYTTIGWTHHDRFASNAKYGPAFAIVSPFKTNIMISDPNVSTELFKNWQTWVKEEGLYSIFNAYGKNVITVNGEDWRRHRKVTAPAFKEANSKLVWNATRKQADGVVRKWAGAGEINLSSLREDMEKTAMHVLMSAAFGKEYEFETGLKAVEPGHEISFAQAMHTCVGSIAVSVVPIVFAAAKLPKFLIPASLQRLQVAVMEVRSFLKNAVDGEKAALASGIPPRDNLISTLVRANEEEKKESGGSRWALTDDELYGNLFIFNLAGHETTSSSLSNALSLLAIFPEVQKWVRAEIDAVSAEIGLEDYNEVFPRLSRTLALMHETQRFFSAVPMVPKYSGSVPQTLKLNGTDTVIPPHTFVTINPNALHFNPATWGSDVNDFRPSRWISEPGLPGQEKFAAPDGAEFVGWASGPRACPGKRFSQVEFVAAIAKLLTETDISPAARERESTDQARERLREVAFDVEHVLSLDLKNPGGAGIECVKRSDR